jgi:hypothetical protein
LVEAKTAVYPKEAREVVWRFRDLQRTHPHSAPGEEPLTLLAADIISPGAKDLLKQERVGYFDSGGSLYLPAPGAYVYIERPPPKALAKSMRSLFSGRRAQALHALLARHQRWFGVKGLAEQAHVSPATASQVLTELERLGWMTSRGQGPNKERHLQQPGELLDSWVKQIALNPPPSFRRYYVSNTKSDQLLDRIDQVFASHNVAYEASFESAAQIYAPFISTISQIRCRLFPGDSAGVAISELGARPVSEGANLAIVDAKSTGELLFRERVGNVWLASPVQVYLDLMRGEGRAKEMAEHLRNERIGF